MDARHAQNSFPEVVIDGGPQALNETEAQEKAGELSQKNPKYPVTYDTTPKCATGSEYASYECDGLQAVLATGSTKPGPCEPIEDVGFALKEPDHGQPTRRKVPVLCGMGRKLVLLLLMAAIVAMGVGIGVGVGVGVRTTVTRSRQAEASASTSVPSTSTESETSARPSTTNSTTTSAASPSQTFLNNMTGPVGFAFQGFSGRQYSEKATDIYRAEGFTDLPYNCSSYVWLPNGTNCCVTFCQDDAAPVGWWCHARMQPNASSAFQRIFIGCGNLASEDNSRCS